MDNTTTNVQGREIKFRGYSYAKQKWLYGNLIEKDDPQKGEPTPWVRLIHNRALDAEMVAFSSVGQFTGLRDKSGKEIYEGDIMTGRNRVLKVVKWDSKRAAFVYIEQFKPKTVKISFAQMYDKFKSFFNKDGILYNHEVVGNLYEHPHLLKSEGLVVSEGLIDHGV